MLGATPVNGVATLSDLQLNKAGTGYTLQISTEDLPAVTTAPFTVIGAAATQLVVTTQPSSVVTAGNGFGFVVSAEDANGNIDPNFNGNVTLALAHPGGGARSAAR